MDGAAASRSLASLLTLLLLTGAARAQERAVADSSNRFAQSLYGELKGEKGNLFFSPLSLTSALGMTSAGARGQTAAEMRKVLRFTLPEPTLHPALGKLVARLTEKGGGQKLGVANALWVRKGLALLPAYLAQMKASYGAAPREIDYAKDPERARKTINGWVERQTLEKIKDLLGPGDVDRGTRLVLTNAIYFHGLWAERFKKEETRDGPFWLTDKKSISTPLMRLAGKKLGYRKARGFTLLELPYKGDRTSMVVLLPDARDGLAAVEKQPWGQELFEGLRETKLQEVVLPRFKLTARYELAKVLETLGMKTAFGSKADFTGIAGKKDPLQISKVIHKAFVDVNEEGTEAAAATAVVMRAGGPPAAAPRFVADHPFLFFIREKATGTILFVGRVVDPR
jgi:serpin B